MKSETLICNTTDITYDKGYIALWCKDYDLPSTIEVSGEILQKKSHFHVSLLCVKNILEVAPDIEDEVLRHFCDFIDSNSMKLTGFSGEFRLVKHEERMSIVAMCEVANLHAFAEYLTEKIKIEVSPQPAHITIYTLQPNAGIGLNSSIELEKKSEVIELPETIQFSLTK